MSVYTDQLNRLKEPRPGQTVSARDNRVIVNALKTHARQGVTGGAALYDHEGGHVRQRPSPPATGFMAIITKRYLDVYISVQPAKGTMRAAVKDTDQNEIDFVYAGSGHPWLPNHTDLLHIVPMPSGWQDTYNGQTFSVRWRVAGGIQVPVLDLNTALGPTGSCALDVTPGTCTLQSVNEDPAPDPP